jgi:hypothetical protein
MKWVTRERARVDRIACPCLISRFIDPAPQFLFVPAREVLAAAQREGATPYDIPNVELTRAPSARSTPSWTATSSTIRRSGRSLESCAAPTPTTVG